MHRLTLTLAALFTTTLPGNHAPRTGQVLGKTDPAAPKVKIESFGPTKAFVVGSENITLVGTIRNIGAAPLPADQIQARMSCLAGLDYAEGDTLPKLPALAPGGTTTYRWRVQPTSSSGPLVASLAVEARGGLPEAEIAPLQRFPQPLPAESANAVSQPRAQAGDETGILENDKVRARIFVSDANVPALFLSAHTPTGWRKAGVSLPLAEVQSGESAQTPWWETFRADEIHAQNTRGEASLHLSGGFGLRWRATMIFTIRVGSSVVDARLLLSPLRPLKLAGVRFVPLYAGDSGFGALVSEELPFDIETKTRVSAVRSGNMTVGGVWPGAPPLADWTTVSRPDITGADYHLIAAEMRASGAPTELTPASLTDFRARLFALTPSLSVRDAFKVFLPTKP